MSWRTLGRKTFSLVAAGLFLTGCSAIDHRASQREAQFEAENPPVGQILTLPDGRRVHAFVQGHGPDLVLIHGASGNLRDFTFDLTRRLTDRYRVIALDRPGMGYTDRTDAAYGTVANNGAESPEEQVAMLQAAADLLDVENPIVLGHSYGGAVAMAWAVARPEDTAALVIVSGATIPWEGGLSYSYKVPSSTLGSAFLVPAVTAFFPESKLEPIVDGVFKPQHAPAGYTKGLGSALSIRRDAMRANARQVNVLKDHLIAMLPRYHSLTLPVEILHGAADTTVPAKVHAIPLSEILPNANLTQLDGIGHMPHHVAPESVVDAIDRARNRAGLHKGL